MCINLYVRVCVTFFRAFKITLFTLMLTSNDEALFYLRQPHSAAVSILLTAEC